MAPGPVQCKGFANTLHYQCNIHHGHFLNVVASFWPVEKPFLIVGPVVMSCRSSLLPHINTIGTRASAGCVSSLLDVVRMACVEVCACMNVGMCDELWYITGTFHLCKPHPKLLNLLLSCVWQVCTHDDYLCLSTSSLGSEKQGDLLCWGYTPFETSQFLVLTNNRDGKVFCCVRIAPSIE